MASQIPDFVTKYGDSKIKLDRAIAHCKTAKSNLYVSLHGFDRVSSVVSLRDKSETELQLAKAKYLKCLKKFNYEQELVNQLTAIRNGLEKAHEIFS